MWPRYELMNANVSADERLSDSVVKSRISQNMMASFISASSPNLASRRFSFPSSWSRFLGTKRLKAAFSWRWRYSESRY